LPTVKPELGRAAGDGAGLGRYFDIVAFRTQPGGPSEELRGGAPSSENVAKLLNDFSEERRSTKRLRGIRRVAALLLALFTMGAHAQTEETRTLKRENGPSITYVLRTYPADAHLLRPDAKPVPTSALDSAKLIYLYLSDGDIEEAALLSNSPRRRYEVLRDYRESVGEVEFKKVFAQYMAADNRLIAEIAIDKRSLLIWDLRTGADRIAGQYFVEVDGNYLIDDVPNDQRTLLRWVLEAYRSGKIPR
jgi:hypothetical protein